MSIANEFITRGHYRGGIDGADGGTCLIGAAGYATGMSEGTHFVPTWRVWLALPEHVRRALVRALPIGWTVPDNCDWITVDEDGFQLVWLFSDLNDADEVLRVAKEVDELLDQEASGVTAEAPSATREASA